MININVPSSGTQALRLKIKTLDNQLQNLAMSGAGISSWEAKVLVDIVNDIYFQEAELNNILLPGQTKYTCISSSEAAGKPLNQCQMVTVVLTLFAKDDKEDLPCSNKQACVFLRHRRLLRMTDEAIEQNGLLSQEDLAEILMCDVRTIRRDIAYFRKIGIIVPTRGAVKDIGPGVTHKEWAIRLWLEGREPGEISPHIHHSLKATENYLEKFKRIAYLIQKGFTEHEMALTVGISVRAVQTFKEIYNDFKGKALFKLRMEEISIAGKKLQLVEGEKKISLLCKKSRTEM